MIVQKGKHRFYSRLSLNYSFLSLSVSESVQLFATVPPKSRMATRRTIEAAILKIICENFMENRILIIEEKIFI